MANAKQRRPRIQQRLDDIDQFVDGLPLVDDVKIIDKTQTGQGGRPRLPALRMIKILFLQHLYNLSDPEIEDQLLSSALLPGLCRHRRGRRPTQLLDHLALQGGPGRASPARWTL